jgi:hypothetical protein
MEECGVALRPVHKADEIDKRVVELANFFAHDVIIASIAVDNSASDVCIIHIL